MSGSTEYGEKFEGLIVTTMCTVMILCLVGVGMLVNYGVSQCQPTEYTYCEEKH